MSTTEHDKLAQEISDAFWAIEGNYHRETSGPGSRFEGKELTLVQAEWVLNHLAFWGYRKAPDVVQVVERVLTHHLGFPKLPPAEWVDEAAHIAGIVEEIRAELGEVQR